MKVNRVILSSNNNPTYYHFWNPLSKVYKEKFKIQPTLVWIGTKEEAQECGISEEYGDVIYQEPNPNYLIPWQCTWAFHWATKFFPEDVCLIIGIDQIPLSNRIFKMIENISDDHYCIMLSDAYLPSSWANEGGTSPSGWLIAKGKTFMEVNGFDDDFHKEIEKVANSPVKAFYENTEGRWGIDESYSCENVRRWRDKGGKVHAPGIFRQEIEGNNRRIECERHKETGYDIERLMAGEYSESHLCRPYTNHVNYINRILQHIPTYDS